MSIITLLTDFGTKDYYVGAMKGVILSINRSATVVDISHEIKPQQILSAAFVLENSYKYFPSGTIHVAVVDPGVGSSRRAILVEAQGHFFVAPDNGLLSFVFRKSDDFKAFVLENENYFLPNRSNTFHGRDVFAPVAAHLSSGVQPEKFGRQIFDPIILEVSEPRKISDSRIVGEIIHIDRFGNLVTNIKAEALPEKFRLKIGGHVIEKHLRFYAEANQAEPFSIIGSSGYVEISVFADSAEKFLGASVRETVEIEIISS